MYTESICLLKFSLAFARRLDKRHVDVREYTARGNRCVLEQSVQLLVVSDCELDVTRHDPRLLAIFSSVASKLKHLGCQILEDGGKVDWSTSADTAGGFLLLEESANSSDGELQASATGLGLNPAGGRLSFSSSFRNHIELDSCF